MDRAGWPGMAMPFLMAFLVLISAFTSAERTWCQPAVPVMPGRSLDVAIVATGAPRWPEVSVMLTSMLHFRSCPLVLHFLGAEKIREHVERLVEGKYTDLTLKFHALPKVNMENAGFENLARFDGAEAYLVMDQVIPNTSTDYLLALDLDLMFTNDICAALTEFDYMSVVAPKAVFAMAPEMSPWYTWADNLANGFHVEPTLRLSNGLSVAESEGLNSGVIFWNLRNARAINWSNIWAAELPSLVERYGVTHMPMPDQDVLNMFGKSRPEIMHVLDLKWNFQVMQSLWDWGIGHDPRFQHAIIIQGNNRAFQTMPFWHHVCSLFASPGNPKRCAERSSIQTLWSRLPPV